MGRADAAVCDELTICGAPTTTPTKPASKLTDDTALLERIGIDVVAVPSSTKNFKVTLPEDLRRAPQALLRVRFENAP